MSHSSEELEIISCYNKIIEDGHVENEMAENQNDLKQPTICFSSYNHPMEPCLIMEFDELKDAHACYNAYPR
jgi:hypothetical protein